MHTMDETKGSKVASKERKVAWLREAGSVRRGHNLDQHNECTIAQHSYNLANLILMLHPDPSFELIKAALWHDVPERWLGDIPSPAKHNNAGLRREYEELEDQIYKSLDMLDLYQGLSDEDRIWLKACDCLELEIWAVEQLDLGNNRVMPVIAKLGQYFDSGDVPLPKEITEFRNKYDPRRNTDDLPE